MTNVFTFEDAGPIADEIMCYLKQREIVFSYDRKPSHTDTGSAAFGVVSWNEDDIKAALEECDVPESKTAIEEVRRFIEGKNFEDDMTETGNLLIAEYISEHYKEWEARNNEA